MLKKTVLLLWGLVPILVIGCSKVPATKHLNQFSLLVDGVPWHVSESTTDPCQKAFHASESFGPYEVGQQPEPSYYHIYAIQDPLVFEGVADVKNKLEIQVYDVAEIGHYLIDGSDQENFQSFVRFLVTTAEGEKKLYKNDQRGNFVFSIDRFINTSTLSGLRGIAGEFAGTLYEVSEPSDSLVISQGEYLFAKMNWTNFDQCAP